MVGITSVTLRGMGVNELTALCRRCGIGQIEWGGDIHVPPGDLELAKLARDAASAAGVEITSYGSYYRLGEDKNGGGASFPDILNTADILGASLIRIWAGDRSMEEAEPEYLEKVTRELVLICRMASEKGISLGLEYHRRTLTETCSGTKKLLSMADCPNLFTYWQMNPDISHEERLKELDCLKPDLCGIHVFYWGKHDERQPLAKGYGQWQEYMRLLKGFQGPFLLEFVKNDDIGQVKDDGITLASLLELRE